MSRLRVRVLFLAHSADWGGAQKCLFELLRHLPSERFESLVVFPADGPVAEAVRQLGMETRQVFLPWCVGYGAFDFEPLAHFADSLNDRIDQLATFIRDERVDLVFTNTITLVDGALAAARANVPHIWHIHELLGSDPALPAFVPLEWLYSAVDALSETVVVVSEAVRHELQSKHPQSKARIVHNGIAPLASARSDKASTFGLPPDALVVTYLGLLSERKGVVFLAQAIAQVIARQPKARFVLAGPDGGKEQDVRAIAEKTGVAHAVLLTGPRKDVPAILSASDVFVMPSLADPLPLSVLEAMSLSLPVVATRSGGCEQMVVDGVTGRLVPTADSEALAEAISELLAEPERAREMGKAGRARVKHHFSVERYADEFATLMTDCVARGVSQDDRAAIASGHLSLVRHCARERAQNLRLRHEISTRDLKIAALEQETNMVRRDPVLGPWRLRRQYRNRSKPKKQP